MGHATHLVTLAHRVSVIHGRYLKRHSLAVTFSLGRFVSRLSRRDAQEFCRYQSELTELNKELEQTAAFLASGTRLEPSTTLGDEFKLALEEYIQALSYTIQCLSAICRARCHEQRDGEEYGPEQVRAERLAYDESLQRYRRLGGQLTRLYQRL